MVLTLRIGSRALARMATVHSPVVMTPAPERKVKRQVVDIDYTAVKNAMVIMEHDSFGHELPIALAYVSEQGQVMVGYIHDLAEVE